MKKINDENESEPTTDSDTNSSNSHSGRSITPSNMTGDEEDFERYNEDQSECDLVKCYFGLHENSEENECVSKTNSLIFDHETRATKLSLNKARLYKLKLKDLGNAMSTETFSEMRNEIYSTILNDFLNDKFNPFFTVDSEYKCKQVQNPIWNYYEKCQKAQAFKPATAEATELIHFYRENKAFKSLFTEIVESELNIDEMNLLDELYLDLSKSTSKAYALYQELFNRQSFMKNQTNLDRLCGLVDKLLNSSDKKENSPYQVKKIRIGFKYTNLLLTKYDQEVSHKLLEQHNIQFKLLSLYESMIFDYH